MQLLPELNRSVIYNVFFILRFRHLGSGCSKAVEHTPHDREVMGSNPARCWANKLYPIRSVSLIRSLMEEHLIFRLKLHVHSGAA